MFVKRVLLKLSGESLSGSSSLINVSSLLRTVNEIKIAVNNKIQLAIVIGAGNIWRGADKFINRVTADKMGMLATVMNALALNDALWKIGIRSKVFSANGVSSFVEDFRIENVIKSIEQGSLVIFAGGTGNPFFTTDTTAALRAAEIDADMLLKATRVDGVYNTDPKKNKNAIKFSSLTFKEALRRHLKIMDAEAFSLCMQTNISIVVFNFYEDGNLWKILSGKKIGTIVEA
ncbi:MAG: UMP kinase [Endomicrobium sp.]|jgi:uridylate kinase|nr:UMP kinase [Endomicrobium sp.]